MNGGHPHPKGALNATAQGTDRHRQCTNQLLTAMCGPEHDAQMHPDAGTACSCPGAGQGGLCNWGGGRCLLSKASQSLCPARPTPQHLWDAVCPLPRRGQQEDGGGPDRLQARERRLQEGTEKSEAKSALQKIRGEQVGGEMGGERDGREEGEGVKGGGGLCSQLECRPGQEARRCFGLRFQLGAVAGSRLWERGLISPAARERLRGQGLQQRGHKGQPPHSARVHPGTSWPGLAALQSRCEPEQGRQEGLAAHAEDRSAPGNGQPRPGSLRSHVLYASASPFPPLKAHVRFGSEGARQLARDCGDPGAQSKQGLGEKRAGDARVESTGQEDKGRWRTGGIRIS